MTLPDWTRRFARAAAAALALALLVRFADAAPWRPVAVDGRVRWGAPAGTIGPDTLADPGAASWSRGDTLGAWAARAADSSLPAVTLREYALALVGAGRAAAADSVLASPRLTSSLWAWDALRVREGLALAGGDTARAESLLATANTAAWIDGERSAWTLRRAKVAAARGEVAAAEEQCRLALRLYPSLVPTGSALALLDSLARARGDSLSAADERAGAESDALRGANASAAKRLRHVRPRFEPAERWKVALRLAEVLRASRMPKAARAAGDTAVKLAPEGEPRDRARLELARAMRDGGASSDSALAAFARLGEKASTPALRATAWWEYAREAEDLSRWSDAVKGLGHVAQLGERRADDARVRAGLVLYARGEPDSARAWWRRSSSEAARFWLGVALRASDRAASDSLLKPLALSPGYGFYRAAARETLALSPWRGDVAALRPLPPDSASRRWPSNWGLADDEIRELAARLASVKPAASPGQWLTAAAGAYAIGRTAQGTRWAERASVAAADADSVAWAIVPWAYPPAYEREVAAVESLGVERNLLWALMRQESRFEPRARSVSNALGLTQLKVSTAGDAAQWLREPKPTESTLFAPDTSIRIGARYLKRMLDRHDGVVSVALAAYNAGPSAVRPDWRELVARGGEALYAEFASNADSQDYVRRILGFRQAYRQLRPTSLP